MKTLLNFIHENNEIKDNIINDIISPLQKRFKCNCELKISKYNEFNIYIEKTWDESMDVMHFITDNLGIKGYFDDANRSFCFEYKSYIKITIKFKYEDNN